MKGYPRRILLGEEDFKELVRGQPIRIGDVEIALADIGWDRMYFQIERAMRDAGVTDL